jgi:hypothetical protein
MELQSVITTSFCRPLHQNPGPVKQFYAHDKLPVELLLHLRSIRLYWKNVPQIYVNQKTLYLIIMIGEVVSRLQILTKAASKRGQVSIHKPYIFIFIRTNSLKGK